ncbi:MAG: LysM peptidoglycan-binding domain-containing protein, partial [Anaerolineae bacterium]|nr:LysM peptidoglycan-binding domain-containing protein [Anaerolineae bacterium]
PAPAKRPRRWPRRLALVALTVAGALAVALAMGQGPAGLELRELEIPRLALPDLSPFLQRVAAMVRPAQPDETPSPVAESTEAPTPTLQPTYTPEPPTATPEPTSTPSPAPLIHTVARGETLALIAQRYGVSVAELMAANNLATEVLSIGQQLVIPGRTQGAPSPAATLPAVHVVQPGENLLLIAERYGLSVAALMEAN